MMLTSLCEHHDECVLALMSSIGSIAVESRMQFAFVKCHLFVVQVVDADRALEDHPAKKQQVDECPEVLEAVI
eukprot:4977436-Amphidinium_carterae.1